MELFFFKIEAYKLCVHSWKIYRSLQELSVCIGAATGVCHMELSPRADKRTPYCTLLLFPCPALPGTSSSPVQLCPGKGSNLPPPLTPNGFPFLTSSALHSSSMLLPLGE